MGSFNRAKVLLRVLIALAAVATAAVLISEAAAAQSWWPFGGSNDEEERPPVPREPVYRQPSDVPPPPDAPPQPGVPQSPAAPQPPPQPQPGAATNYSTKNPICFQLEQRLVQEGQKGNASDSLPRIEDQIRTLDRSYNVGQSQLDNSCYDSFLFTKTFRDTPRCKDLQRQVESAKARLSDLEAQRQSIMGSSGRSYKDDIIRELARNNCGANYVDMARRRNDGMWEDEESGGGNTWSRSATNGAQTYRTLCVRLCDGFYFPVSFSTLPSHFPQDAEVCTSKCAAPTELYYYPNPGGSVDQSVALRTQEAYTKLKVAFRYRKEYVNGCSCKTAEYVPPPGSEKKADATDLKGSIDPARRSDAATAPLTTGSTANSVTAAPLAPVTPAPATPDAASAPSGSNSGWQTDAVPNTQPAPPQ